ncbi:2Fe-2S iron-sulfur cluster binding domain-containing protein, partial [Mesorhizobium sp. M4B.F.Ca.ET.088.02.2.1]
IFCCGPDPFMRAVRQMLEAAGFDMARYHQESFAAPAVEEVPAPFALPGDGGVETPVEAATPVRFSLSDVDAECLAGQTVLQTARASGVRIPAACEFGLCGTCKVRKVSGEVAMSHNGGILDHEIDDGFILACCSRPLTRLEIEA